MHKKRKLYFLKKQKNEDLKKKQGAKKLNYKQT